MRRTSSSGGATPSPISRIERSRLEPAHRLVDVADREHADAVEAQPLECVLERLRNPFDHDDDRRGAGGRGATHLIFEQRSAGERKQRAKRAAIVFLIGADQRADRHCLGFPPQRSSLSL